MTTLKITDIEGIGPAYAEKLQSLGIKTSDDLLVKGKTPQGRKEISQKSEISDKLILKWVNMADLIRIKGVGEEYSELLEVSGVDTVVELSNRNAENLQEKMQQVNDQKNLVRRPPTLNEVEKWIAQAKDLPRAVEYSSTSSSSVIIADTEPDKESDSDDEENLQDIEDRIEALQEKLRRLSAGLQTAQTEVNPDKVILKPSVIDKTEIINKPKGVLPKGFVEKPSTTKHSRGKLSKGF